MFTTRVRRIIPEQHHTHTHTQTQHTHTHKNNNIQTHTDTDIGHPPTHPHYTFIILLFVATNPITQPTHPSTHPLTITNSLSCYLWQHTPPTQPTHPSIHPPTHPLTPCKSYHLSPRRAHPPTTAGPRVLPAKHTPTPSGPPGPPAP